MFKNFSNLATAIQSLYTSSEIKTVLQRFLTRVDSLRTFLSSLPQSYTNRYNAVQMLQYDSNGKVVDVTPDAQLSVPNALIINAISQLDTNRAVLEADAITLNNVNISAAIQGYKPIFTAAVGLQMVGGLGVVADDNDTHSLVTRGMNKLHEAGCDVMFNKIRDGGDLTSDVRLVSSTGATFLVYGICAVNIKTDYGVAKSLILASNQLNEYDYDIADNPKFAKIILCSQSAESLTHVWYSPDSTEQSEQLNCLIELDVSLAEARTSQLTGSSVQYRLVSTRILQMDNQFQAFIGYPRTTSNFIDPRPEPSVKLGNFLLSSLGLDDIQDALIQLKQ